MKIYRLLVPLLAATADLYAQGGAAADGREPPGAAGTEQPWAAGPGEALLSEPLSAYDSPWEALSRYDFSFVRYLPRGYDRRTERVTLGGADLADPLDGMPCWGLLSALRDAAVPEYAVPGLRGAESSPGAEGGIREYGPDPLSDSRGGRLGWMLADRRFRQGVRLSTSSGELRGGWAATAAFARRWGGDRHVRGVWADDWTIFASVAKRLRTRHVLSAVFIEAPSRRGLRSATVSEAFSLIGDPLYNPSWGAQQGRIRSSRVRSERQPMALLSWKYVPSDAWSLTTTLACRWGSSAIGSPDWYDAWSPQPDYYRNLPGFYDDPLVGTAVREAWERGDPLATQIDWTGMYRANALREDSSAAYVIGSAVRRCRDFQMVSFFSHRTAPWLHLSGGLRLRGGRTTCFRRLDDLLGAAYLTDIDPYLIDDRYFGDRLQNDLRHPGRRVREGDAYGYRYDLDYGRAGGWLFARMQGADHPRWSGYAGLDAGVLVFSRNGRYEKELSPGGASFGRSAVMRFAELTFKAGLGYRFSPRHSLSLDWMAGRQAPEAEDVFVSPRYRNETAPGSRPESVWSAEVGYRLDARAVSLTVRVYGTWRSGRSQIVSYYDDLASVYSDMLLSGVDRLYAGAELGAEWRLGRRLALRVAAARMRHLFRSDPRVVIRSDKDGSVIADRTRTALRGFCTGDSPQRVAAAELRYDGARLWTAAVSAGYAGDRYVTPSPLYRMRRVTDRASSPEQVGVLTEQRRLPDAVTLRLFASKSFRIGTHYLTLSGSVDNLLDDRRIVYSAYEPMRLRKTGSGADTRVEAFASRYLYGYGRTYYLTVNFRF